MKGSVPFVGLAKVLSVYPCTTKLLDGTVQLFMQSKLIEKYFISPVKIPPI